MKDSNTAQIKKSTVGGLEKNLSGAQNSLESEHAKLTKLFQQVELAKRQWEQTMDCIGEMVPVVDDQDRIIRCNRVHYEIDVTSALKKKLGGGKC